MPQSIVEDRFVMKNFILISALAMLPGTMVLNPLNARAQSTSVPAASTQDPKQVEFIQTWYAACSKNDANNVEKCCQLSKELTDKYPEAGTQYLDYARREIGNCNLNKAAEKFGAAITAYYGTPPDTNKLEALFTAGDDYLRLD